MAVTLNNTFEGGTDGVNITTSTSGDVSGDALFVSSPAGSVVTWSTDAAAHGILGAKVVNSSSSVASFLQFSPTAADRMAARVYFKIGATPVGASPPLMSFRGSGGALNVILKTNGRLAFSNASGADSTPTRMTDVLALDTWHRIECGVKVSTGEVDLAYYLGDSESAIEVLNVTGVTVGSTDIGTVRIGHTSATAWTGTLLFDDFMVKDLTTGFIGPYTAPDPEPVVTVVNVSAPMRAVGANPGTGWE